MCRPLSLWPSFLVCSWSVWNFSLQKTCFFAFLHSNFYRLYGFTVIAFFLPLHMDLHFSLIEMKKRILLSLEVAGVNKLFIFWLSLMIFPSREGRCDFFSQKKSAMSIWRIPFCCEPTKHNELVILIFCLSSHVLLWKGGSKEIHFTVIFMFMLIIMSLSVLFFFPITAANSTGRLVKFFTCFPSACIESPL